MKADAPAIQRLLRETWQDTYEGYLSRATVDEVYGNWHSIDVLLRQIENPAVYFSVATDSGELVGTATARSVEGTTVLLRLFVRPARQREGIGRQLLEAVTAHFSNNRKMQLHVEALAEKAQAFYRKHGFQVMRNEQLTVVHETVDGFLMEKVLPAG